MPGYRGRLAPSPTGSLHLGHARTFLVAWLRAREVGGTLVLRVEDLDRDRSRPGVEDEQRRDLEWLGLDWDEMPGVDCRQSGRSELYEQALQRLRTKHSVFPCTCSRREIAAVASAPHGADELGRRYPGTCRERPSHPDRPASIRFRMDDRPDGFFDEVFGEVEASAWGGDFVLRRADGQWSYQLAVVVDDAAMGVTEVVRGSDLLSSTPRQIALYRALGFRPPRHLHVPIVRGLDGERLSKRHGSESIRSLRERGVSAARVVGTLAEGLGMVAPDAEAKPDELVGRLDLSRVRHAPESVRISP